jgi:hypothetical protein
MSRVILDKSSNISILEETIDVACMESLESKPRNCNDHQENVTQIEPRNNNGNGKNGTQDESVKSFFKSDKIGTKELSSDERPQKNVEVGIEDAMLDIQELRIDWKPIYANLSKCSEYIGSIRNSDNYDQPADLKTVNFISVLEQAQPHLTIEHVDYESQGLYADSVKQYSDKSKSISDYTPIGIKRNEREISAEANNNDSFNFKRELRVHKDSEPVLNPNSVKKRRRNTDFGKHRNEKQLTSFNFRGNGQNPHDSTQMKPSRFSTAQMPASFVFQSTSNYNANYIPTPPVKLPTQSPRNTKLEEAKEQNIQENKHVQAMQGRDYDSIETSKPNRSEFSYLGLSSFGATSIPSNIETERLEALHSLKILDSGEGINIFINRPETR